MGGYKLFMQNNSILVSYLNTFTCHTGNMKIIESSTRPMVLNTANDPELYEAAVIDGAGRWKQTLYITLPGIVSTIVVLLILRLGQIMSVGYEKRGQRLSETGRRTAARRS